MKIRGKRFGFFCYILTYKQISKQRLGRKQGIIIEHLVVLCLSPLQKTMESILRNAFFSVLEGHNFKFFLPLSTDHGGASGVSKYITNGMPKKSLSTALFCYYYQSLPGDNVKRIWAHRFFAKQKTDIKWQLEVWEVL